MKQYPSIHILQRFNPRPSLRPTAVALCCALAGCLISPVEPGQPGEPRQVRTAFSFQDSQQSEYGMFVRLDEDPEARGQFSGTITMNGTAYFGTRYVEIGPTEATMSASGALRIEAGGLPSDYPIVTWDTIELRLQDPEGDRVLTTGTGRIASSSGGFEDDFTAARDGFPVMAQAYRAWDAASVMLPWDTITIALGQPVSSDEIQRIRVLADGEEVPGQLEPRESGALHTQLDFVPDGFYPLGTTVTIDPGGMENALGVPVILADYSVPVQSDPGSMLPNLGFEQQLSGWYGVGDATVVASAGEMVPVEGAGMAALQTWPTRDSRLIGYFDVPVDASALDVSLALLASDEGLPQSITMRLYYDRAEGGRGTRKVYEFVHSSAVFEPCACGELDEDTPLSQRAGPIQHQIDLSTLRGERVFLEIRMFGEPWSGRRQVAAAPVTALVPPPPPVPALLLVDDLQIH